MTTTLSALDTAMRLITRTPPESAVFSKAFRAELSQALFEVQTSVLQGMARAARKRQLRAHAMESLTNYAQALIRQTDGTGPHQEADRLYKVLTDDIFALAHYPNKPCSMCYGKSPTWKDTNCPSCGNLGEIEEGVAAGPTPTSEDIDKAYRAATTISAEQLRKADQSGVLPPDAPTPSNTD